MRQLTLQSILLTQNKPHSLQYPCALWWRFEHEERHNGHIVYLNNSSQSTTELIFHHYRLITPKHEEPDLRAALWLSHMTSFSHRKWNKKWKSCNDSVSICKRLLVSRLSHLLSSLNLSFCWFLSDLKYFLSVLFNKGSLCTTTKANETLSNGRKMWHSHTWNA